MGVICNALPIKTDMTVPALGVFCTIGSKRGYVIKVCSSLRTAPGEIEDIVKLTEPQARIIAQCYAGPRYSISAIRLIAHDIQTFLKAVIIIAEQQRIFAMLENALAGEVILQDGDTAAVESVHRSIVDRVVDRGDAQNASAHRNPCQRELHTYVCLQRCNRAV